MVEVYLSSNLQANPAMEIRDMNYSYRTRENCTRTFWLFHEYPAHIPQRLSTEKDTDAMNLERPSLNLIKNIMSWSYIQSTITPYGSAFRTTRLEVEIWPV